MRFFSTVLVGASALVSLVAAQSKTLYLTSTISNVQAGQQYNITFAAPNNSPVTILLRKGSNADLKTVATLTESATGGSYLWTPSSQLQTGGDYALQIKQGSEENYSQQFPLTGGAPAGVSSAASSAASAASSAASSAAASASSAVSAAVSSALASVTGTASTGLPTGMTNGTTITTATLTASRTPSPTGGSATTGGSSTAPTGAASNVKSPMALVFGAVAAIAYLG